MIPRYSRPEMAALWSEEAKLNHWLEIEVLACEGMAQIGVIPAEVAQIVRAKAAFDIEKVRENIAASPRPICSTPRSHCNASPARICCSKTWANSAPPSPFARRNTNSRR
jgi:hypothetical protein